jgi:hypothetical protein
MVEFTSNLLMLGWTSQQLFGVEFPFSLLLLVVEEVTTVVTVPSFLLYMPVVSVNLWNALCLIKFPLF